MSPLPHLNGNAVVTIPVLRFTDLKILTIHRFIGRARSRRCLNRFEFANVVCGKMPVPGTLDDKLFVFVTGQRRIELRMATIERDKERPFRITLRPHIMILTGVLVLVVRSSRSKAFVLVEVFQFSVREFVNDAPDLSSFLIQDVRDASSAVDRLKRKRQTM